MSLSPKFCVYRMMFPNEKLYFGITSDIKRRIRSHRHCEKYEMSKRPIVHAIKKYGWDSVALTILAENLEADEAYKMESELIAKHRTQDFENGYNLASGGRTNVGYKHPNVWAKGATFTSEHREKLRQAKINDKNLKQRSSDASSMFPVVVTHLWTGERLKFKNANVAAATIGVKVCTARNHVRRGSHVLDGEWTIRRIESTV